MNKINLKLPAKKNFYFNNYAFILKGIYWEVHMSASPVNKMPQFIGIIFAFKKQTYQELYDFALNKMPNKLLIEKKKVKK